MLSLVGYFEWNSVQTRIDLPSNTEGFLVFVSPYASYRDVELGFKIDGISPITKGADVTITAKFNAVGDANGTFIMAIQIPYNYTGLWTEGAMSVWENYTRLASSYLYNGSIPFKSSTYDAQRNATYIYMAFERRLGNTVGGAQNYNLFEFTIRFHWPSSIFTQSYSRSSIIVPFALHYSGDYYEYVPRFVSPVFPESCRLILQVTAPKDSMTTLIEPGSQHLALANGQVSYSWNTTEIAARADPRYPLITQLSFDMRDKLEDKERAIFLSGLWLGTGIPLAISASVESYKSWRDEKDRDGRAEE